jgi:PHD/YefM family antitoxin component YafN of YafNO toxin-antitoxin module
MAKDIPITTARHELTSLPGLLEKDPGAVTITRRGKPVLAVMRWEFYETLLETIEVLGDPELMEALRCSLEEIENGQTIDWEDAKRILER